MPIGEIYKESEKLYETEEKIKLQTQNSATSLAELFIEQIDNEMLRDKKREKQRGIALKDAGTEEAYEENLELYEQLTGSLIMQNPACHGLRYGCAAPSDSKGRVAYRFRRRQKEGKGCAVLFGFQRTGGGYRESPLTFHAEKLRGLQPSFLIF